MLTQISQIIWEKKYKTEKESSIEETFARVAKAIANNKQQEGKFFEIMSSFKFIPGGRILAYAGRGNEKATLSNCYVMSDPEDSMDGIMKSLHECALTMKAGGGIGLNFSNLRPAGDYVRGTDSQSSGPVSFMQMWNAMSRTIAGAGCFTGDTLISTTCGLIPIKQIVESDKTFYVYTHKGIKKVTCKFHNGVKPTYKVETTSGHSVTVTEDHKFAMLTETGIDFVPLKELKEGDLILLLLTHNFNDDCQYARLLSPDKNLCDLNTNLDVKLPEFLDEDIAYFVGNYLANGVNIKRYNRGSYKGITIAFNSKTRLTVKAKIEQIIKDKFNYSPKVYKPENENCYRISVYSVLIARWLSINGFLKPKSQEVQVPQLIFVSPKSVQAAFVAGVIDGDGCIKSKKHGIKIDSTSIDFLRGIQLLLQNFGIASKIVNKGRLRKNWKVIYSLTINGFTWQKRTVDAIMKYSALTPPEISSKDSSYFYYPCKIIKDLLSIKNSEIRHIDACKKDRLHYRTLSKIRPYSEYLNVIPVKIKTISPAGYNETYDLEVEDVHALSGNGIYTSNSRRGAMIAVMNIDHPDIEKFIAAKRENTSKNPVLEMFNISVAITDDFIEAVREDREWQLKFNGKVYKTIKARKLWHLIVENNWAKAEPGVIFIDRVNKLNNLWYCERITATNPCGEQPLPPNGACTLGAINLTQFVINPFLENATINTHDLAQTVATAVEFLDNTVDKNYYPLDTQRTEAQSKRRIGLGIMGLGSALAMMGVKYNSEEALEIIDIIMSTIQTTAYLTSVKIAKEKGAFPLFDKEKYLFGNPESFAANLPPEIKREIQKYGIRNGCLLTVAPTGSISQLANNVSSGVEPIFSLSYIRRNYNEEFEVNDYAWEMYKKIEVTTNGDKPEYFVTAHEISPEWHIKIMAQVQKYVDASISKTINLPRETTIEQMMDIYLLAYNSGLKGCTTYRAGCLETEILSTEKKKEETKKEIKFYERPYKLESKTYKVKIPGTQHAYYLTFSYEKIEDKNKPIELFINTKDTSMEEWTKLIGRMVSAVFRQVDDPTFLIEEFKQIYSPSGFFSPKRRKFIPSLQAEFGEVMKDFFIEIGLLDPEVPVEEYENNLGKCPACGKKGAIYEEGCIKCLLCGYSKCG